MRCAVLHPPLRTYSIAYSTYTGYVRSASGSRLSCARFACVVTHTCTHSLHTRVVFDFTSRSAGKLDSHSHHRHTQADRAAPRPSLCYLRNAHFGEPGWLHSSSLTFLHKPGRLLAAQHRPSATDRITFHFWQQQHTDQTPTRFGLALGLCLSSIISFSAGKAHPTPLYRLCPLLSCHHSVVFDTAPIRTLTTFNVFWQDGQSTRLSADQSG